MARVQYGTIVTELKGKIAGQVFQRGNNAYVLRNKGYKRGKASEFRSEATLQLSIISGAWRDLSDGNRAAWDAAKGTWPFKDKFGNTYYGSGFQMYMAYNTALFQLGLSFTETPFPPVTPEPPDFLNFSAVGGVGIFLDMGATASMPQWCQVFASPTYSVGRNGGNVPFRLLANIDMAEGVSVDLTNNYIDAWGQFRAGTKITFLTQVRASEFPYPNYITTTVVTVT